MRSRALVVACFGFMCVALAVPADAAGPVYNVNSFSDVIDAVTDGVCDADPGPATVCTLRAAVGEAYFYFADFGGTEEVTINLQIGNYDLTIPRGGDFDFKDGDLNLAGEIRLVGKGAGWLNAPATIIDAKNGDRVFFVYPGSTITFEDLWINGGRPPNTTNVYRNGGGIFNDRSHITLTRCLVRDNDTVFGDGGGIYSSNGTVDIRESNFRLNDAAYGGALSSADGAVTISRSTLNGNSATLDGGALRIARGSLDVSNSTISDNYAVGRGGCCWVDTAAVRLNNVTMAINRADDAQVPAAGGLRLTGTSTVAFSNSILLNTRQNLAYDDLGCGPSTTASSNGHNLILVTNGCPINGATSSAATGINPLADYGGTMATRALAAGSPALNAGKPTGCEEPLGGPMTTDQRGVKRPIGSACDLGAFEAEPIGDANGDGIVSVADVLYLVNYLFAGGPVPLGRANVNGGDGSINVSDVLYLINYLFAGGPAPA